MHFNKPKLKISARSSKGKARRVEKKDIVPVSKIGKKNNNLSIKKNALKSNLELDRMEYKDCSGEDKIYKSLSEWKGILPGHTAFILGNSPSIGQENLTILDDYFTIGINRIFYIYEPTVLFWQDKRLWDSEKKNIVTQKSIKVCRDISDPLKLFINFRLRMKDFSFGDSPSVLNGVGNSGALAVQLAVAMGCSSIVLLGTDCTYDADRKTDFYGINRDHIPGTLKMCMAAMKWLKNYCPVPVYNCSSNPLWERKKLEDLIKEINPMKCNKEHYRKVFLKPCIQ